MEPASNQKRIESIYQMLFEMAAGNFNFRIERTGLDDELEGLIVLVNMVAEELRATVFHNGYINSHFTYQYLIQSTFILDQQFIIDSFNPDLSNSLGYLNEELYRAPFVRFLSMDSSYVWNLVRGPILWDQQYHKTFQLTFKAKSGLLIPAFCTITRLLHSSKILISSVTIVVQDNLDANPVMLNSTTEKAHVPKSYDAKLIQQLYDFILENLDSPLPSVKELSSKFATNEHKLKDGFRHFFKTSIYQFYNEERLKRAHLLIQQTDIPLKSIAYMTGFNIYTNFSKAFKKRFSYAPNMLKRNDVDGFLNGEQL
jgi:AraC-like DNA-binding protein